MLPTPYSGPFRRSTDKPNRPPTTPGAQARKAQVLEITNAVATTLAPEHFSERTRLRMLQDWRRGVSELSLRITYRDHNKVLGRELVEGILQITVDAEMRKLEQQVAQLKGEVSRMANHGVRITRRAA